MYLEIFVWMLWMDLTEQVLSSNKALLQPLTTLPPQEQVAGSEKPLLKSSRS